MWADSQNAIEILDWANQCQQRVVCLGCHCLTQLWSSPHNEGSADVLSKKLLWRVSKTEDVAEPACVHAGVPIVSASNQNASQALVWAIDANSTLFA